MENRGSKIPPLSFADVNITPKQGKTFDLQLYFDSAPLGSEKFDSPEKIKESVKGSSEEYLPQTVEKSLELRELTVKGWYGWYTVLTDAKLAALATVPAGEFKYITRGMIRLSQDSVLGFSLLTNTLETDECQKPFEYILSFVKGGPQIFTFGQKPENYLKPYSLINRETGNFIEHCKDRLVLIKIKGYGR